MPKSQKVARVTVVKTKNRSKAITTTFVAIGFIVVASLGYFAGSVNAGHFFFGGGIGQLFGANQLDFSSLQQTYNALKANYDGDVDSTKLLEGANKGMVESLGDQYTIYMNAKESSEFDDSLSGNIGGGVGIEVGMRHDLPTILRLLKDNPAEKSGLAVGDILTAINGEDTKGETLTEVVMKIRGDVNTTVKLTIDREGVSKDFVITRAKVNNPSAYGKVQDGVGILTVSRFDNETGVLARSVANDFVSRGVKAVILDLRGNGGGYLTAAQAVAGLWLNDQLVVTEKRGTAVTDSLKSTGEPVLKGLPTVVLVNESSASASEIVAGALHDHKVATLIGTKTFGKGSVQKLLDLNGGATLKVTVAKWFTPNGINISEKGIEPDTVVKLDISAINAGDDTQLDAAIAKLK